MQSVSLMVVRREPILPTTPDSQNIEPPQRVDIDPHRGQISLSVTLRGQIMSSDREHDMCSVRNA